MAYSNNWSITEIAGISDLRDSYQWNGEKRLWKMLFLRRISDYSSSNAGTEGSNINDTTPDKNTIPQTINDTSIQQSVVRHGGGIRYYAIPGFLAGGKNIIALGGVNVGSAASEQAYNHATMTWGNSEKEPSKIRNWGYFNTHQYPTILLGCENFSRDVFSPIFSEKDVEDFYVGPNKLFLSENVALPQFIAYCSPQADFYLSSYSLTAPNFNNTMSCKTLSSETESGQLVNMVLNWDATTNITGSANIDEFQCYKVKSGYNRIPTQSMRPTQGIYKLNLSKDKEKFFITIKISNSSSCIMESDYFYLEKGKYYYKLDDAISGLATLSGVISGSLTTSWTNATVSSAGFAKLTITYASGTVVTNEEIRPILILSDSYPDTKWNDVCVVNDRPNFIKDSLFYQKNKTLTKNITNTHSITTTLVDMNDWPGFQVVTHGYRWSDLGGGVVGHTFKFNLSHTFKVNCNHQRLVPWNITSTYSEALSLDISNTINETSKYGSWTVALPDNTQPRTFNKTNYFCEFISRLPFISSTNTDKVTSEALKDDSKVRYYGIKATTNTDLCSVFSYQYDTHILIATQLYRNDKYISKPQCPIIFDEKPVVYFVKNIYREMFVPKYSYKPYWGASQISTSTYPESTLSITFYIDGVAGTVDFLVPTLTGSTTATVSGKTFTWYGPNNSTHPGEIVCSSGFNSSCNLSPYSYGYTSSSSGVDVVNCVGAQSKRITGEVKDAGTTYHSFTITQQGTPNTVTTNDGQYTMRYIWQDNTLQLLDLTPLNGGGGAYTITTAQNIKFYKN